MSGAAGLCWYADSRLYTPLLVANLNKDNDSVDADLGKLFGSMVGTRESNVEGGLFPIDEQKKDNLHQWKRVVSSTFGQYAAKEAENPDSITGRGFFRVSLARHGSTLLFSLDDKLVDKAIGTLDKHFLTLPEGTEPDGHWQWLPLQWRAM